MKAPRTGYGRAIVWVSDYDAAKMANGIALPEGYEILPEIPIASPERMALGFIVESRDIPETGAGMALPSLSILPDYQAIVVERYR